MGFIAGYSTYAPPEYDFIVSVFSGIIAGVVYGMIFFAVRFIWLIVKR
jgi:hypothetical protein